jgi:hypothetical protein
VLANQHSYKGDFMAQFRNALVLSTTCITLAFASASFAAPATAPVATNKLVEVKKEEKKDVKKEEKKDEKKAEQAK